MERNSPPTTVYNEDSMTSCENCGAPAGPAIAFCGACGTPAPILTPTADHLPERAACALAYGLWALSGVLFLAIEPYNRSRNVRFHSFQSIFLSLAIFGAWFVVLFSVFIFRLIPAVGPPVALAAIYAFGLAILGMWILMIFRTFQGLDTRLPVIGSWAEKAALSLTSTSRDDR